MEQGKFYKQAEKFALTNGFASATYAGVENNYEYYRLNRAYKIGKYFGRPCVIKYTQKGRRLDVEDTSEMFDALVRANELCIST